MLKGMGKFMWGIDLYRPERILLIASPVGPIQSDDGLRIASPAIVWNVKASLFNRIMRGWRKIAKARRRGRLFSVDHVRYESGETSVRFAKDEIGRGILIVGVPFLRAYFESMYGRRSDDVLADMKAIFAYPDDAERAVQGLIDYAISGGGMVSVSAVG